MAEHDELAQLEAERARLLSMIAYQNRPISPWLRTTAIGVLCGIAIFIVVAIAYGQNSVSDLILFIVVVGLSGYILTRKITVFGTTIPMIAVITLSPLGPPAGELETRQRLADCEARITKFKEWHS